MLAAAEEKEIDLRPDGPLSGNGETVLAVEDNVPLRRIVVRQLRALGLSRAGGWRRRRGAGDSRSRNGIDLLFTDVVMPGGWTASRSPTAAILGSPASRS
jgi:CheY-like chemotaxis protein